LIEQLIQELRIAQGEIAASLAEGHASSYEAYKELTGRFAGLEQALTIIDNILHSDEDDNR
jgi:hypothetical protein